MCIKNLFSKIFNRHLKNEPMYFETDSYAELSEFYNNEANKIADVSSAVLPKDLNAMSDRLNCRRVHDEKVLDFRRMKKNKNLSKKEQREKEISQIQPSQSFLNKQRQEQDKISSSLVPVKAQHVAVEVISKDKDDDDLPEE